MAGSSSAVGLQGAFAAVLGVRVQLLEAMTARACQEEVSLERLETMGDCFLKLAVGVHVYRALPEASEDALTRAREAAISNFALAATAQRVQLQVRHPPSHCSSQCSAHCSVHCEGPIRSACPVPISLGHAPSVC